MAFNYVFKQIDSSKKIDCKLANECYINYSTFQLLSITFKLL